MSLQLQHHFTVIIFHIPYLLQRGKIQILVPEQNFQLINKNILFINLSL